jgi:hypothetical protein
MTEQPKSKPNAKRPAGFEQQLVAGLPLSG